MREAPVMFLDFTVMRLVKGSTTLVSAAYATVGMPSECIHLGAELSQAIKRLVINIPVLESSFLSKQSTSLTWSAQGFGYFRQKAEVTVFQECLNV